MRLEGIHHITAITADAQSNVDFYAGVMGLRLVKKTVNQDDPTVYHLFYADEQGSAGADITFFEYPGAPPRPRGARGGGPRAVLSPLPAPRARPPGRGGAGVVPRGTSRVASAGALDFWETRLGEHGLR